MTYILDASILIKIVLKEEDSWRVEQIFSDIRTHKNKLLSCELWLYETFNTLGRKLSYGEAVGALEVFADTPFEVLKSDVNTALQLMQKFPKISFYDASYHALAIEHEGVFITADRKYYEITKEAGNVMLLADYV